VRGDDLMNEAGLDGGGGLCMASVYEGRAFELGAALAIEQDDVAGVEALLEGVAGRLLAADVGDGSLISNPL
jgi:hypothetical protein